jgi:predicted ATP-grasp superfamily ATP-dependent carboligase
MDTQRTVPALVAGADTPTGLAIAAGLQGEGVPVIGLAEDTGAAACTSHAWTAVLPVDGPDAGAWLAALRAAHARYGRCVLLAADDAVVRIVGQHRAEVDALVEIVLPAWSQVEPLLDKTAFHDWATEHGFPVPATAVVTSAEELAAALATMAFPVVLKPFERTTAWQAASGRDKVRRLDSAADLDDWGFRPFDVADRFVVQEWIPGLDSDVWFCLTYRDRDGREVVSQVGRKITQWPVDTGSSALAVTAEHPALQALTHRLLDAAGHVGFGSLEVRRSSRNGNLYITEPTVGRANLQTALATAAGTNLAVAAYRDALRLPQPPPAPTRPAVWVHETAFPRSLVVGALRRRLDVVEVAAALARRATRVGAFRAAGDRGPVRAEWRRLVGRLARRRPAVVPAATPQVHIPAQRTSPEHLPVRRARGTTSRR